MNLDDFKAHANRIPEKKDRQKVQDLWSHLASNSFTFCSLQPDIRGAGWANDQGLEQRGRMSRLTPDPAAKPARPCRALRPSFGNKGEGPDTSQAATVFLARLQLLCVPLRGMLQDHIQQRTHTALVHCVC